MAREYARIRLAIADDEDFEALSTAAQWLYLRVLIPDPTLSYAGVADWRPKRLKRKAKGADLAYILAAASELEQATYCLFDLDTEEVLVRTFIRNDEILRNPKMAAAMVKAYRQTASKTLQAAIVSEVRKAKEEHPEYSSWDFSTTREDLSALLTKPGSDSVPYTNVIAVPITNPVPGADYQSDSVPIPPNSTSTTQPSTFNKGGSVSGVRHQTIAEPPEKTPRPHCNRHPEQNAKGNCGDCGRRREWDEAEEAARKADELASRRARREAIDACGLCDQNGKREVGRNALTDCEHPAEYRLEVS